MTSDYQTQGKPGLLSEVDFSLLSAEKLKLILKHRHPQRWKNLYCGLVLVFKEKKLEKNIFIN